MGSVLLWLYSEVPTPRSPRAVEAAKSTFTNALIGLARPADCPNPIAAKLTVRRSTQPCRAIIPSFDQSTDCQVAIARPTESSRKRTSALSRIARTPRPQMCDFSGSFGVVGGECVVESE